MPAAGFPAAGIRVSSGKLLIGMRANRLHRPDLWIPVFMAMPRMLAELSAWEEFNRRARSAPGAVGIWHETYVVNRAEPMYVGMPLTGLAAATGSREAGTGSRAAQRLGPARRAA
ncbi:monooxygenase family protein [Arthrobacter koreensis]|uniref:monooxygenase family protein n=1 Tax=Arthrobacter koreensis TaxID=199136 RepID=UPI000A77C77D|nr:DUF4188 domain-containing protein [Arthrobacter koreensis]